MMLRSTATLEQVTDMATPSFVKFSRIHGALVESLERLDEALSRRWESTLRHVARLQPSFDDYDGGLELVGEFQECDSPRKASAMMERSDAFGLIYVARVIPAMFYFYLFDRAPKEFSITLSVDSSIVYYRTDDFDSGQWFEGLLTTIVCALRPSVCGYGYDDAYGIKHESLDPGVVLSRLRSGELLGLRRPTFHAISTKLIEKSEIDALIEQYKPNPSPNYRMAPGYHILGSVGL
jgi:hypothetical protein